MKRPLRTGRSLPAIIGRDITRKFLTCVERHREQCQKTSSSKLSNHSKIAIFPIFYGQNESMNNLEVLAGAQVRDLLIIHLI